MEWSDNQRPKGSKVEDDTKRASCERGMWINLWERINCMTIFCSLSGVHWKAPNMQEAFGHQKDIMIFFSFLFYDVPESHFCKERQGEKQKKNDLSSSSSFYKWPH